jgi:2-succinyl-5-enolpyruvyl-6-hydroxy-3-cyclohexene-1-carboxylate synthase
LLPAVVEADRAELPLVLLTADRPPEARDAGANQTIDQPRLYGTRVRWECDLPCPDAAIDPRFVLTSAGLAVRHAQGQPSGPVHLNVMFREPLVSGPGVEKRAWPASVGLWRDSAAPFTACGRPRNALHDEAIETMSQAFRDAARGLVVVGTLPPHEPRDRILQQLGALGWPICADITSGMRLGPSGDGLIPYHDLLLQDADRLGYPDVVLHLGGPLVSKRLGRYLAASAPRRYVHVAPGLSRYDPDHRVTLRVCADMDTLADCRAVWSGANVAGDWREAWLRRNRVVADVLGRFDAEEPGVSEPGVARVVAAGLPPGHGLVLGNSMPVRDAHVFAGPGGSNAPVAANRGASGIDGTVATALGFSVGCGRPVTVLVGDLAMLHDLGSLDLVRRAAQPLTVVVLNNDGGGIFSFLPLARHDDVLEPFLSTPHGRSFAAAAGMFDLGYACPQTLAEFDEAYRAAQAAGTPWLIEVCTRRTANLALHERLERDVMDGLRRC